MSNYPHIIWVTLFMTCSVTYTCHWIYWIPFWKLCEGLQWVVLGKFYNFFKFGFFKDKEKSWKNKELILSTSTALNKCNATFYNCKYFMSYFWSQNRETDTDCDKLFTMALWTWRSRRRRRSQWGPWRKWRHGHWGCGWGGKCPSLEFYHRLVHNVKHSKIYTSSRSEFIISS